MLIELGGLTVNILLRLFDLASVAHTNQSLAAAQNVARLDEAPALAHVNAQSLRIFPFFFFNEVLFIISYFHLHLGVGPLEVADVHG